MSDFIDRNDAIEAIEFEKVYMTAYKGNSNGYVSEGNPLKQYNKGLDDAIKAVNSLTPAEPKRKKGKWIPVESQTVNGRCSVCGYESHLYENDVYGEYFCPHCGTDMRGE